VVVRAEVHDCLLLPTEAPTTKKSAWVETLRLNVAFGLVIERIKHLMSHGLLTMMVLHGFLSRSIAPLQAHARPAWMYTGEGDTTRLEHSHDLGMDQDVLGTLLARLSPDPSSANFITPLAACAPMCSDQAVRMRLLWELLTLDDIDIAVQ
jgi:hypothetical protein